MGLKQMRKEKGLTQAKCAEYLQIPIRSYKRYEANEDKISQMKYAYMVNRLNEYGFVDEEHGILTVDEIKKICSDVFKGFQVDYCFLSDPMPKEKRQSKAMLICLFPCLWMD